MTTHADQSHTLPLTSQRSAGSPRQEILVLYCRDEARVVALAEGQESIIGRGLPSDIAIPDRNLSRQHALVEMIDGRVWVEDLQSTNGTYVNGTRIDRCAISAADEVTLGGVTLVLQSRGRLAQPRGPDSHGRFRGWLEEEVGRARFFGRSVAVLMIRAPQTTGSSLGRWHPVVCSLVRPVDRLGQYCPDTLEILLPEMGETEARRLAERILEARSPAEPPPLFGIGLFPQALSAEALIEAGAHALQTATPSAPIRVAPSDSPALGADEVVCCSPAMRPIMETVRRLGQSSIPVLIQGETGVGKEVVARAIHAGGSRRAKPLCCINCGAIPSQLLESALFGHERGAFTGADARRKGLFEQADGGTVLLDEIGELSAAAQAALLRVLETRRLSRVGSSQEIAVDVRVLAATNSDLEQMCDAGSFRRDLLFRLNAMILRIPPLRDRREEIEPLVSYFLRRACSEAGRPILRLADDVVELLLHHDWPGNVRELRNAIERAAVVAQADTITVDDLPEGIRALDRRDARLDLRNKLRGHESDIIVDALRRCAWNQTRAAAELGIPRRTLVRKLREYGLQRRGGRSAEDRDGAEEPSGG
jgi:DNA-binding NtrC family response regulator